MNLLVVELRRNLARRFLWTTLFVVFAAVVLTAILVFTNHTSAAPARPADALQQSAQNKALQDQCRQSSPDPEQCASIFQNPGGSIYVSDRRFKASAIWAPREGLNPGGFDGRSTTGPKRGDTGAVPAVGVVAAILAAILGATFVGAEYRAGTIETLLLWEPRRLRVLAAKMAAGMIVAAAVTAVILVVLTAALYPSILARGTTAGINGAFWRGLAGTIALAALGSALLAAASMSIASIGRNTSAAIGFLAVGIFGAQIMASAVLRSAQPLLPGTNLVAAMLRADVTKTMRVAGGGSTDVVAHGPGEAMVIVALYAMAAAVLAAVAFRQRDISE